MRAVSIGAAIVVAFLVAAVAGPGTAAGAAAFVATFGVSVANQKNRLTHVLGAVLATVFAVAVDRSVLMVLGAGYPETIAAVRAHMLYAPAFAVIFGLTAQIDHPNDLSTPRAARADRL